MPCLWKTPKNPPKSPEENDSKNDPDAEQQWITSPQIRHDGVRRADEGHVKSKCTSGPMEPGISRVARRSEGRTTQTQAEYPTLHAPYVAAGPRKESRRS
jgi:hypothetical protein